MRTTRFRSLATMFAAAVSLAVGTLAAGPAHADTFYGPPNPAPAGAPTLPTVNGAYSQPLNVYSGGPASAFTSEVIEVPFNSSTSGTTARTYTANGSNAQRIYFQKVGAATVYPTADHVVAQSWSTYRILHYTQNGPLCLDADGSHGAPGGGSAVTWFSCDPAFANQPNQLWLYKPVGGDSAIYNLAASQTVGNKLTVAPIVADAPSTGNLSLQLPPRSAQSAGWVIRDMTGAPPSWGECAGTSCVILVG